MDVQPSHRRHLRVKDDVLRDDRMNDDGNGDVITQSNINK